MSEPTNAAVTLYKDPGFGGDSQDITVDTKDLTGTFPNGVNSISVGESAGKWQAFTQVSYGGPHVILLPGHRYGSSEEMGLNSAVRSLRKPR